MASIVQRNNRYCVVYLYDDETSGRRRQKWESFRTMADAKKRKAEIEYRQELGTLVIHKVYQQHSTHEALHFPDYREHETE